jgi:hypothetical protein
VTHLVGWTVAHTDPNDSTATPPAISRIFNQQGKKGLFGAWDTTGSVNVELNISLGAVQSSPLELNIQGSISEINISPNGASIPISTTQQFNANGKYNSTDTTTTDMTNAAFWSTEGNAINLSETTPGSVTGASVGSSSLTVTCAGESDSVTVTVTEAAKVERVSIDFPEEFVEMIQSETVELKAIAHNSDGTTNDITEDDGTNWSVRIIDTDRARPINVTSDTDPVDKGRVTYIIGDDIPTGEKRFAEVVVKYNNLEDDIVVVVIP